MMRSTTKFGRLLSGTDAPVCAQATFDSPLAKPRSYRALGTIGFTAKNIHFYSTMNFYRNRHSAAKTQANPYFYSTIIWRGRRFHLAHERVPRP
jgi:hypothetical protein